MNTSDAPRINSYQDLDVWKLAVAASAKSYRMTAAFPREEIYGITSLIRRASISIVANIAEGYGRDQTGQFIQFLRIAQGSARELEALLVVAEQIGMPVDKNASNPKAECERICKMLRSLIRSVEARSDRPGS
jgi:four helix bundle protein